MEGSGPAADAERGADVDESPVEQNRFRAGAGLLLLPSLGPALELGVRVAGDFWVEAEGWLALSRLNDGHAPPAMGFGPRLSCRWLSPSWELRGSLAVPILQDDRQYVDVDASSTDEVRDYLVPSLAPGLAAGYRLGPITIGLDAELVLAWTEYLDYSTFTATEARQGWHSRGTTLTAFPRLTLMASCAF